MNKEAVIKIIEEVLNDYFETQDMNEKATKDTALFGKDTILDSMGLVNVIIDIESRFLDEDIEVSLTSESAMSRRNSPFRTVETLADFIMEQIGDDNE
jgi:acyl carrier protein